MPRLPIQLQDLDLQLPRQPRGTVQVPEFAPVEENARAAGALGAGIASVGQGLQQGTELFLQGRAIEARRADAQAVLDGESAAHEYHNELNKSFDSLRSAGQFEDMPEQLTERSKALVATMGASLTPRARQVLGTKANAYLTTILTDARQERYKRLEAQKGLVAFEAAEMAKSGLINAETPDKQLYWQNYLTSVVGNMVGSLLMTPANGAKFLQGVKAEVAVGKIRRDMRINAKETATALEEQAKGGTLEIGGVAIVDLIDEARKEQDAALRRNEHQELVAARDLAKKQDATANPLYRRLYKPGITTGELAQIYQEADALRAKEEISEADHKDITGHAQAMTGQLRREGEARAAQGRAEARAQAAVQQDRLRTEAVLRAESASTPHEYDSVKAWVVAHKDGMDSGAFASSLALIHTRRDQTNWTNLDDVRLGRQIILGRAFPQGVEVSLDKLDSATKVKSGTALDIFNQTMETLHAKGGAPVVKQKAQEEARRIADLYFPPQEEAGLLTDPLRFLPAVPKELDGLSYDDALLKLDEMVVPVALKVQIGQRLELQEQERVRKETAQKGAAAPPPPTKSWMDWVHGR